MFRRNSLYSISIVFLFVFNIKASYGQKAYDSLKQAVKTLPETEKAAVYNRLARFAIQTSFDAAFDYTTEALSLAQKHNNKKQEALAYINMGNLYKAEKTQKALDYLQKAIIIQQEINDTANITRTYNTLGNIYANIGLYTKATTHYKKAYEINKKLNKTINTGIDLYNIGNMQYYQGKYDTAISIYHQAIDIFEKTDYKKGVASIWNSIASVYKEWEKPEKATHSYLKALTIEISIKNTIGIANTNANLGIIKDIQKQYDSAIHYYKKALKIRREIDDKAGIANTYNNLGTTYLHKKDYEKAIEYFNLALEKNKALNRNYGIISNYFALGQIHYEKKEYSEALNCFKESLELANKNSSMDMQRVNHEEMVKVYESTKDFENALKHYKLYTKLNDSIFSSTKHKQIMQLQIQYDTEKKEQKNKLLEHKNELQAAEIKNQKLIAYVIYIGLGVLVILILVVYNRYTIKKKANKELKAQNSLILRQKEEISAQMDEIEAQRDEIDAQHNVTIKQRDKIFEQKKEITDSIQYASKIQTAILPHDKFLDDILKDYFVYYKPRDIVSGDFYWATQRNEYKIIVAADCTGHGVPGAFMSMMGAAFLSEIVNKKSINTAASVLDALRDKIVRALQQTGKIGEQRDGMDIAICVIDSNLKQIQVAAANNPVLYIKADTLKNNENITENELIEIKGDKMPISFYDKMEPYTNHIIDTNNGDLIYMFSDGYPDQFGGTKGKKYMIRKFKRLLLTNCKKTMQEQKNIMHTEITNWMNHEKPNGEKYEQIDDMLVVGIKLNF